MDVTVLAELIRRASDVLPPRLEEAVFATTDPDRVAGVLTGFLESTVGPVREAIFYNPSVGIVVGVRLEDGRDVVVKVHRWNVTVDRLEAIQRVQTRLADMGMPWPRPLAPPQPLGGGLATVEDLLPNGPADGHDPAIRDTLAQGLHRLIHAGIDPETVTELGPPFLHHPPAPALWPEAHDLRFDFQATAETAEWVDDLAKVARRRLEASRSLPTTVGHFDWRVQNLGFDGHRIVGVFDADSLTVVPEAVVVGHTAAIFSADWASDDPDPLPSLAEMQAFVEDYQHHRGVPFTSNEMQALDAANLLACAYGARCQHSDLQLHPEISSAPHTCWLRLLRQRGESAF